MSLLTIATALARNVGMADPDVIVLSPFREWKEALLFANETGEELARRVDWGQIRKTITLTGDGTNLAHSMPADFSRLTRGMAILAGTSPVRPLTQQEFARLSPSEGQPRYFNLEGKVVRLWPYLAIAATSAAQYQSTAWCSNGTNSFSADTDTSLIDEWIFAKALIVRWRRQKGMPYADEEAEFEAALADVARFNDGSRL